MVIKTEADSDDRPCQWLASMPNVAVNICVYLFLQNGELVTSDTPEFSSLYKQLMGMPKNVYCKEFLRVAPDIISGPGRI